MLVAERPRLAQGSPWRRTCVFCHNTVPYLSTLFDELYGDAGRAPKYQGAASIRLPPTRRFRFEVTDPAALGHALDAEITALGGDPPDDDVAIPERLRAAAEATRHTFDEGHLLELGIGCEACHGGAREHVANTAVLPSFAAKSEAFRVATPKGAVPSHADDVNRTCVKCHTVLFTHYPYTWEGGSLDGNPGGSVINSGEARDFLLGGCTGELHCAKCHDPHVEDPKERLQALLGQTGTELCTSCHRELATEAAVARHTHHTPGGPGSACLACHMPKKNLGLAYRLTRYHRIGSPTEPARVEKDRPLECALCHAEQSVEKLVSTMEQWWSKRYDRDALRTLFGEDLTTTAVRATLVRGKPHERAVAAAVAGEHHLQVLLPELVGALGDDYPLVRFFVKQALDDVTGEKVPLDVHAPGKELSAAARAWLRARQDHRTQARSSGQLIR